MIINLKEQRLLPFALCCIAVLHEAISFSAFPFLLPLSYLILALCLLGFLIMGAIYMRRPFISSFGLVTTVLLFELIILSFINSADLRNAIYSSVNIWLVLLLFFYFNKKPKMLVMAIALTFSVAIYLNTILAVFFPNWTYVTDSQIDAFLLGGNYNQMGCRFISGMVFSMICIKYSKWWLVNTILISLISIITLVLVNSMTSFSVIMLFVLLCLIPSANIQKAVFLGWFFMFVLFHVFVVFNGEGLHNNEMAVYIVEDVLGKDITFTGRTYQWVSAVTVISKSPIWGYGYVDIDWYLANMSSFAIGPHNFILSLLIYGGIIMLLLYIVLFSLSIRQLFTLKDRTSTILLLGIMSLTFMMTFETYPIFFIFLLLIVAYYYPTISSSDKSILNKETIML